MKLKDIRSRNWSLSLDAYGRVVEGIDDISQCIIVIVTTVKGTDPLRPEFGSDLFSYLDRPISEAIPQMIRSSVEAIGIWETRVEITKVSFAQDGGAVEFTFDWQEKTSSQTGSTKVLINGIT